jgi:hypothetical protein
MVNRVEIPKNPSSRKICSGTETTWAVLEINLDSMLRRCRRYLKSIMVRHRKPNLQARILLNRSGDCTRWVTQ